jgi:hypothetical protein
MVGTDNPKLEFPDLSDRISDESSQPLEAPFMDNVSSAQNTTTRYPETSPTAQNDMRLGSVPAPNRRTAWPDGPAGSLASGCSERAAGGTGERRSIAV